MATRALSSGLWVRRLRISESPDYGRYPASELNDGARPEKPAHLTLDRAQEYWAALNSRIIDHLVLERLSSRDLQFR
jgi:hypothetical protein